MRWSVAIAAITLGLAGLGVFLWKHVHHGTPIVPDTSARVWRLDWTIPYEATSTRTRIEFALPESTASQAILDARHLARALALESDTGAALDRYEAERLPATAAVVRANRQVGADNVLFETDFPHPTCLYPNVREHVTKSLEGLSEADQRKVLYENAARVYNLPTPV